MSQCPIYIFFFSIYILNISSWAPDVLPCLNPLSSSSLSHLSNFKVHASLVYVIQPSCQQIPGSYLWSVPFPHSSASVFSTSTCPKFIHLGPISGTTPYSSWYLLQHLTQILVSTDTQWLLFVYLFFKWIECPRHWSEGQKLKQKVPLLITSLWCAILKKQYGYLLGSQTLVILESPGALGKHTTGPTLLQCTWACSSLAFRWF